MTLSDGVENILQECKKTKTAVFVSSSGLDIAFQTLLEDVRDDIIVLENKVRPEFITRFAAGKTFYLQCKMLRLQSTKVSPHGMFMSFEMQENSVVEDTRQSERFMFTPDEKVVAEISNPFDGRTVLKRAVMDMSATGLSLRINHPTKPFSPGVMLPHVKVTIDGKLWKTAQAEVVYNRKFLDLDGALRVQVGLKFLASEDLTAMRT
jgi:hypothetical protein